MQKLSYMFYFNLLYFLISKKTSKKLIQKYVILTSCEEKY